MNMHLRSGSHAILASFLIAGSASAQTVFVDTASDVVDFAGAQRVADLPGPDGRISLPEAGLASDNTPGVQTIGFHIPPSEWDFQNFFPGRAVLRPFLGFRTFDTVILDARTQTAFTGETNPDGGGEVVIWQETYLIDNVGGAVYGFDNSSIHLSGGSGNVIQGNTNTGVEVYDSSSNLIGGASAGQGNTGGVIQIDRASHNVVVGNTVSRVRVLGWIGGNQPATNNRIGGPTAPERNFITGFGTWNSEGWPGGYAVQLFDAIGTVIENNQIGTTPDGLHQGHEATTSGIWLDSENHDTRIRGNRIAGILGRRIGPYPGVLGTAIEIGGTGSGVEITGNTIGLDANGAPTLGSVTGIRTSNYYLGAVQGVVIGGSAAGAGNEIAGHLGAGIEVANTLSGVRIAGNSIHDDGGLGIDLLTNGFQTGVTPNDPLDADAGANGLQNFPVLASASTNGTAISVDGTLDSTPSTSFLVQFFATPQCDGAGHGEGQQFLGSTTITTSASGSAAFSVTLPAAVAAGWVATATATHATAGSTSEFSACVAFTPGPPSAGTGFCSGDGTGSACPCGNAGAPGNGCAHALNPAGANLIGAGVTSLGNDTLVLSGSGMPNSSALYFQGSTQQNGGSGSAFGDGLRCAGGTVIRLGTKLNASGGSSYPEAGDVAISLRGLVTAPGTRAYQAWYRNAAAFCTPSTFNLTNGWLVSWVL